MIELLSGVGAIGISYQSCPYWKRRDGRGLLAISLWWVKILITTPWEDITPLGHGSAVSMYGFFWWPKLKMKPNWYWETLK